MFPFTLPTVRSPSRANSAPTQLASVGSPSAVPFGIRGFSMSPCCKIAFKLALYLWNEALESLCLVVSSPSGERRVT